MNIVFADVDKMKSLHLDVPQSTELVYRLKLDSNDTVLNAQHCAELIYKTLED